MSKYTTELRTIIKQGFDIFDFTFTRTQESKSIVDDEKLKQGFIDHFFFNEIGAETLERWKHFLKTQWCESLDGFDKKLVAFAKEIDPLSTYKDNTQNLSIYEDTPKSATTEEITHATTKTLNKQTSQGYTGQTEIELLNTYAQGIRDIQTEFYESFSNLFMGVM